MLTGFSKAKCPSCGHEFTVMDGRDIQCAGGLLVILVGSGIYVREHVVQRYALAGIEPAQQRTFVVAGKGRVNVVEDGIDGGFQFRRAFPDHPFRAAQVHFYGVGASLRISLDGNVSV